MAKYVLRPAVTSAILASFFLALTVIKGQTADPLPGHLRDRGPGVASSMFGTYIARGELIIYPYWEYYFDNNTEYSPEEYGYAGTASFRGRYRASEELFFIAYGLTENLALQAEIAAVSATLEMSPEDQSSMTDKIKESAVADREIQFRWRWVEESGNRPELWGYLDIGFPHNKDKPLIGTTGRERELGFGLTRGLPWGTVTVRASGAYDSSSDPTFGFGEWGIEYLRRTSPTWRFLGALQGSGDEATLITEAQWHLKPWVFIRFNQEIGLTPNSTDWEPQLGVLFTIPTGRR